MRNVIVALSDRELALLDRAVADNASVRTRFLRKIVREYLETRYPEEFAKKVEQE